MTHAEILRNLVRELEASRETCADNGRVFLLDGRALTALLRAIVNEAPEFRSDREAAVVRGRLLEAGALYSVVTQHVDWTPKGGAL